MKYWIAAAVRRKHWILAFAAAALFVATAAAVPARLDLPAAGTAGEARPPRVAVLKHDPRFVLEAVAGRMGIVLQPDIAPPLIRLESSTPLAHMQGAAERQWGLRPTSFLNVYVAASNEIYLIDDAASYERHSRTLDEALAHELVHYFQAAYRKDGLAGDVSELEAVGVQAWFRTNFMTPHPLLAGAPREAMAH